MWLTLVLFAGRVVVPPVLVVVVVEVPWLVVMVGGGLPGLGPDS